MKRPTKLEIRLLCYGESGLLSDTDIARRLGLKHRHTAALRMWRVHKWRYAQRRFRRTKT